MPKGKLLTPSTYFMGATAVNFGELQRYLVDTDQAEFLDAITQAKNEGLSDGEILISYYAKLCYAALTTRKNENISKVRNIQDNLEGTIKSGHGSVFEHCYLNFTVSNCSRVFTHELVRHRVGTSFCLSGDSVVKFRHASGKLERVRVGDLHRTWERGRLHQESEGDAQYSRERIKSKRIRVLNERTGVFEWSHIADMQSSGVKEVFEVTLENGHSIKMSKDHRILTRGGFKTIAEGLSSRDFVACNGLAVVGDGLYREVSYLESCRDTGMTQQQIAEDCGASHATIRKWCGKLGVAFPPATFTPGAEPWNKANGGYKCNVSEEGRRKLSENGRKNAGANNPGWRGGITSDRAAIGAWTVQQAPEVHRRNDYTCQNQSCRTRGGKLHCHHVEPVYLSPDRAYDVTNLTTVCRPCHHEIHKTAEAELEFCRNHTGVVLKADPVARRPRSVRKVRVHYSKVVSIRSAGEEPTFDIEIAGEFKNFVANNMVVHNSQTSGRYVRSDKLDLVIDPILAPITDEIKYMQGLLEEWYTTAVERMGLNNPDMPFSEKKKITSALRRLMPNGQANEIGFGVNLRSLRNLLVLRTSRHAEWEIRLVFNQILELVEAKYPALFHDCMKESVDNLWEVTFATDKL